MQVRSLLCLPLRVRRWRATARKTAFLLAASHKGETLAFGTLNPQLQPSLDLSPPFYSQGNGR